MKEFQSWIIFKDNNYECIHNEHQSPAGQEKIIIIKKLDAITIMLYEASVTSDLLAPKPIITFYYPVPNSVIIYYLLQT